MSLPKSGAGSDDKSQEDLHPTKNVVQLLNNLSQAGLQLQVSCEWDFVGTTSMPAHICRLTIGSAVYTGAGRSKRSSKHSAAKAAVNALWPDHAVTDEPSSKEVWIPGGQNPITVLNNLVKRRRLSLPEYVVVEERPLRGVGDEEAYTMGCQVGSLMEKASGPCKRIAKREAALRMLERLKGDEKPVPDHSANPLNTAPGRDKSISVRVSPYPRPTRPFPENRRGGSAHSFNTTSGKNEPYTRRPVLPNTGPIRPLVELRQDRSAQEMHQGYDVQGALNTGTTTPPMGNQSGHRTQFNGGPVDQAQHPLIQQINRVPIAHAQNPLEQVAPNTVPIRPPMELRFDRSAPEMHPVLGHNTQHPWTPGPLNTATVRPLMENPQHAEELGGNARFSLTPASLSSGTVRVLLASQQDLGAQGLNSTEGCEEEYIWARVSKITGMAALFLEQKADLQSEKMNTGPERNAGLGMFVTLKPAGTLELPLEELEGPSSPERNAAPGTNANCTLSSPNLIPPRPHLDDRQNTHDQGFTVSQGNNAEYPLTFGKNAGATRAQFSLSHPGMFQTTLENRRDPNVQEFNSAPGKYVGNRVRWPFSFSGMPGHF